MAVLAGWQSRQDPDTSNTYKFAHSKVANSKRQPIVAIGSQFQTNSYDGNPAKLTPTMKEWVLKLLIVAGVLAAVIVPVAVCISIAGWPSGDEQVDEENPPCLDQSREARASQRRSLGIEYFLLSPMSVV
ncbi:hypothetical protein BDZ45DRAFT_811835 [Acephala macrosclerotiorum]|nr:hypothetical protein BDZ45DRAFT_811835 [Acephala macrosclerotiorum]